MPEFRVGDVEKMLPDGMFLHKKYFHRRWDAVIKMRESVLLKAKRVEKMLDREEIKVERNRLDFTGDVSQFRQKAMVRERKKRGPSVPEVVRSAKVVMKQRKNLQFQEGDTVMSLDEKIQASKEKKH